MSQRLHITRATASVMINELLAAGIIASVEHETDRRSFLIRLTELGENKLAVARKDTQIYLEKVSANYPPEMVATLNDFAKRFLGAGRRGTIL
jgi:DNA-binding MarR family transcriptional regulator